MSPQMVIINENTLSAMALRMLIADITTNIDVVCYNSLEEFCSNEEGSVAHFFVSAEVVFRHTDYFNKVKRRTIVVTDGDASAFTQSGFRTLDARASEQDIVRSILHFHHAGHPSGHHHAQIAEHCKESTTPLSQRECDVLRLVVKGHINKEIAEMLNISPTTVIFHRNNISDKLQTRSIGRLTIYAVLNNIVALSEL
jgi:DNA-binding CsgD family transcriptional regulator